MKQWRELREELLQDPEVKKEYDRLKPEYEITDQIIEARIRKNLTQAELAARCNTKQSNISRFERGEYNPSIAFLKKMADGLDMDLHITFTERTSTPRKTAAWTAAKGTALKVADRSKIYVVKSKKMERKTDAEKVT